MFISSWIIRYKYMGTLSRIVANVFVRFVSQSTIQEYLLLGFVLISLLREVFLQTCPYSFWDEVDLNVQGYYFSTAENTPTSQEGFFFSFPKIYYKLPWAK